MDPTEIKNGQARKHFRWQAWVFAVVFTVTLLAGIWFTLYIGRFVDTSNRSELLRLASVGSAGLNAERFLSFTGTAADRNNPDWLAIRNRLEAILKTDSSFRWAYLLYCRDTLVYFFMDMPDARGDAAIPGEHYQDAPEELYAVFKDRKPRVAGPYSDRWGTFVSAFYPVIHPANGQMLAVFGLDIEATHWYEPIYRQQLAPVLVTISLLILQAITYLYVRKRRHYLHQLESAYQDLECRIQERTNDLLATNFELELQIKERKQTEEKLLLKSEELDRFFTVNLDLLCIADTNGYFRRLNIEWERLLGYPLQDLEGKKFIDFVHADDIEKTLQALKELQSNKGVLNFVNRYRCQDGSYRWIEWRAVPFGNRVYAAARDITQKIKTESELRQIKEQLEYILGVTRTGIDIVDTEYNLRYVDPFWQKRYGDYTGKKCYTYFRGRSEPCPACNLSDIFIHRKPVVIEAVLEHEENRIVQVHSIPFQNHDGEWLVAEFNVDITAHKQIEQALRDSETRYRAVMEQATEGILLFDVASRKIIESNRSYQALLGYTADELTALTIYDVVAHERQSIDLYIDRVLQQQRVYIGARKHRHKLGYEVDVDASAYCIELGNQQTICVVVRDIRDRLQAEKTLHNLVRRQAMILQSLPLVFYTASPKGKMPTLWISEQVENITGYPPESFTSDSQFWSQRLHPDEREWVIEKYHSIPHQKEMTLEYRWLCADGHYRWFRDQAMLVVGYRAEEEEIIGFWMDITEKKRSEEEKQNLEVQLQHAQKLESLGVLAGGIAHDFNNLLTSMLGYAEMGTQKIKSDLVVRDYLDEIQKAALRASDLTRQLLAYAGKGKYIVQVISLPLVIREMVSIIQVSVSKKIILNYQFDPDTPMIKADPAQIRQVILNLIINASEAIGSGEGVITIRTGQQWCESKFFETTWLADALPEGNYVLLEVSDTGCGMDAITLSKIFDPFFTTKFSGRGLGLAAVLGIIRGHQAALQVFSEPGRGTTFRIFFPAVSGEEPSIQTSEPVRSAPLSGNILLVDDEAMILKLGKEILELHGFQVEIALDGLEAVNRFQQNPSRYDCILLDLTMPRMDGKEALAAMRRIRPDIQVIISSGYSETEIARLFETDSVAGFIQKPFNMNDLIRIVSEVIQKNLYS